MKADDEAHSPMQCWPALAEYGRTLPLAGGALFYYDSGSAAEPAANAPQPAIILIHGLGDEADSFRHLIPLLAAAGYRVIAPDLPGFGRSNGGSAAIAWKTRISIDAHAQAVLALMQETGAACAGNPAVVIGSSLGAAIAQAIAGKRPDLVRHLVLIDGCFPLSGNTNPGLLVMALPCIGRRWYRAFRKNHDGAWRSLYSYYRDIDALGEADKDFLRKRVIDRVHSLSQEQAYFASLRSMISLVMCKQRKFLKAIKRFNGNILVLWGEADTVIPVEKTELFRRLHPNAELHIIGNAGHLPQQEAPQETAAAIAKQLLCLADI